MKLNLRSLSAFALLLITTFTACRKNDTPPIVNDPSTELRTHTDDQSRVSSELDDVANDANIALEGNAFFSGRLQNTNSICGATTVVDTTSDPRTITITYNGNNCAGTQHRSGSVVLSIPAGVRWKTAGAAITVTFQNLKIKRLRDNKSITINGNQTLTNVTGGLLRNLPNLQQIIHTITSSNMSITFDDNSQRTWQVARKRIFSYNTSAALTIHGIGHNGNVTNAAEWGTNRFGQPFTTSITQPLTFREDCSNRLTSGEIKHEGFATATITFGLNAAGQPTACPSTGSYFYKLAWTGPGGNSYSVIRPY